MDLDLLVFGLDLVSTFAFALVGARVAASKGLDFGGILFIAAIASISGGTLRNLFMGEQPPWVKSLRCLSTDLSVNSLAFATPSTSE
ncbi:MAG: hypothetical protein RIR15_666, partial [Actinomycetota bacterium]